MIVTGGSSGIGKVLCSMLAEKGAKVVVSDIDEDTGSAFVKELRGRGLEATFIRFSMPPICFDAILDMVFILMLFLVHTQMQCHRRRGREKPHRWCCGEVWSD